MSTITAILEADADGTLRSARSRDRGSCKGESPRVIRNIVLSWVVTLPCAAALSAAAYWLIARLGA